MYGVAHLVVCEAAPVGDDVELDSHDGPLQGGVPDEQDEEHGVGERRREVHHLPGRLDSLEDTEEDDDPGEQQAEAQLPAELRAAELDTLGHAQHLCFPVHLG